MRACIRIQRSRESGWRKPANCMIVDRTSDFGNPFSIASAMDVLGLGEAEARKAVVREFDPWLRGSRTNWESDDADQRREKILTRLPELRGKDVACTCRTDQLCHGDTLLEWAALPPAELEARTAWARYRVHRVRDARGLPEMYDQDSLTAVLTRSEKYAALLPL